MSTTERQPDDDREPGTTGDPALPDRLGIGGYRFVVDARSDRSRWRRWTAAERTTGQKASGPSWVLALVVLVILVLLDSGSDGESEVGDPLEIWRDVTEDAKRRFDEENVAEGDIEDAIEWARSR